MRSLAIARYRLLNGVRSSDWVFGMLVCCSAVPLVVALNTEGSRTGAQVMYLRVSSAMAVVAYMLHTLILITAAQVLTKKAGTWGEVIDLPDLLDTVPVSSSTHFAGNAVGVAATLLCVHAASLPLLLFAAVVSPISTEAIIALEAVVIAAVMFFSLVAAAGTRTRGTRWERSRTPRVMATAGLFAIAALAMTTRIAAFRDAFAVLITEPSPLAWRALLDTVFNPVALVLSLVAIAACTAGYLYIHAVRPLQPAPGGELFS